MKAKCPCQRRPGALMRTYNINWDKNVNREIRTYIIVNKSHDLNMNDLKEIWKMRILVSAANLLNNLGIQLNIDYVAQSTKHNIIANFVNGRRLIASASFRFLGSYKKWSHSRNWSCNARTYSWLLSIRVLHVTCLPFYFVILSMAVRNCLFSGSLSIKGLSDNRWERSMPSELSAGGLKLKKL